jgi:two-component system response regulator FlrC
MATKEVSAARILVVEDDPSLREVIEETLDDFGYQTRAVGDGVDALAELMTDADYDLILSDIQMPNMDGLALLDEVSRRWPDLPLVLMTAFGTVAQAVEAIQKGALNYLVKPFDAKALQSAVEATIKNRNWDDSDGQKVLVAEDPVTLELKALAERVAETDATVLLSGESGTGKEVFARFIHQMSARSTGPFVAINCAAIPESMLEAVLFGYVKGAYTGAVQASEGKFEQAQSGTLLLDEISEMDLNLQAKLLRVLQERSVERLGSNKSIDLDVRIIATTNRDMREAVNRGDFREDLFYRLSVFPLRLAPLRERSGDIEVLAERFLKRFGGVRRMKFDPAAIQKLRQYAWPGNVRELENVVQRAVILADTEVLAASTIVFEQDGSSLPTSSNFALVNGSDGSVLRASEQAMILETLTEVQGSRKRAAERLGISPRTLRYKLAKFKEQGIALPA